MANANFSYSTVATAPVPASSGTSLVVAAGDGAKFPSVPFQATIWPFNAQPFASNAEIVTVTNVSTDTLTITRAQEGTAARTVVVGDQIAATITAGIFPTGPLVGTTDTQILTNKTISGASNTLSSISNASLSNSTITIGSTSTSLGGTSATIAGLTLTTPTIASFTNATHNHQNAAGGGTLANAALTNSTVTIGSTSVALGATAATIAGLTLTTPTIASMTNAQHNHTNAAGGGTLGITALTQTYGFRAYSTAAQNTGNAAFAVIAFATEEYDIGNNFASNTFTAPVAGYYQFHARIHTGGSGSRLIIALFKGGVEHSRGQDVSVAFAAGTGVTVSAIMKLAASDTVDARAYGSSALALDTTGNSTVYFTGHFMGA